jgi:hypothetical protein
MNAGMLLTCALSLTANLLPKRGVSPAFAGGGTRPPAGAIDIRAWIDGRSRLILDDDTATWQHFDWAAPGRLNCNLGSPTESTFLDGVAWDPVWPDVPDCENRFCGGCFSSTLSGLQSPLPNSDFTPVLVPIEARGTVAIVEYPSAANGYRVVVEFDDDPEGGAAWYEATSGSPTAARRTTARALPTPRVPRPRSPSPEAWASRPTTRGSSSRAARTGAPGSSSTARTRRGSRSRTDTCASARSTPVSSR